MEVLLNDLFLPIVVGVIVALIVWEITSKWQKKRDKNKKKESQNTKNFQNVWIEKKSINITNIIIQEKNKKSKK